MKLVKEKINLIESLHNNIEDNDCCINTYTTLREYQFKIDKFSFIMTIGYNYNIKCKYTIFNIDYRNVKNFHMGNIYVTYEQCSYGKFINFIRFIKKYNLTDNFLIELDKILINNI